MLFATVSLQTASATSTAAGLKGSLTARVVQQPEPEAHAVRPESSGRSAVDGISYSSGWPQEAS